jgi:glyoxylase-like metal-dependent hydrolase (beta-lactamase superfamily II)
MTASPKLKRRQLLKLGAGCIAFGCSPLLVHTQSGRSDIIASKLGELIVLRGSGCNVVVLADSEAALVIDGGLSANADALLDAIVESTGAQRIATLINTHWHPENTGLNERVGSSDGEIIAHEVTARFLGNTSYSALHEQPISALPSSALPNTVIREDGAFDFSGTKVEYGYLPAAHTNGDIYLRFPELDTLVTGGVVSGESWPLIDYRSGAWYGGRVRALEWLAELVTPQTRVIPDRGRVLSGADIIRQRDIYQSLFETMIGYMNMGYGPEDAVASNPLADLTDEFGDAAEFLDGAYRSMLIAYVPD